MPLRYAYGRHASWLSNSYLQRIKDNLWFRPLRRLPFDALGHNDITGFWLTGLPFCTMLKGETRRI